MSTSCGRLSALFPQEPKERRVESRTMNSIVLVNSGPKVMSGYGKLTPASHELSVADISLGHPESHVLLPIEQVLIGSECPKKDFL